MDSFPAAKRPRIGERTLLACLECKQKKLKCDGKSPKCHTCMKTGRECLVEDPATGIHRPRDYIQTLESRVAYLESLLQAAVPDVATDHYKTLEASINAQNPACRNHGSGIESDCFSARVPFAAAIRSQEAQRSHHLVDDGSFQNKTSVARAQDARVDDLSSEVAMLCLSATGREPHYFGATSAVSFSRIASHALGLKQKGSHTTKEYSSKAGRRERSVPAATPVRLPSLKDAHGLSNAYFCNIHPQYPFLHHPSFSAMEGEVLRANADGEGPGAEAKSSFFVLMVYAIGSLALGTAHHKSAAKYYTMALGLIEHMLETDDLESVQALLCCAVYSVRSPVGASLWKISGMAIRHCIELGYHRSVERYRQHADVLTKEMSKRCFWVAYDIDRVVSNILGRPDGIADQYIDVELPFDVDDDNITHGGILITHSPLESRRPTNMTGAIHIIKLRRLWSRINTQLYSPSSQKDLDEHTLQEFCTEAIRRELEDWRTQIPVQNDSSHVRPLSVFASHKWFQLGYDHSILLLYRPHITDIAQLNVESTNMTNQLSAFQENAFRQCFTVSRDMCLDYRRLYNKPSVQFTWGSLHILFLGGLTYLYCLWHAQSIRDSARPSDVVSTCMACTTVLVVIAERWQMTSTYRDIWEILAERTISMICGERPTSSDRNAASAPQGGRDDQVSRSRTPLRELATGLQDLGASHSHHMVQQLLGRMPDAHNTGSIDGDFDNFASDFFHDELHASQHWA